MKPLAVAFALFAAIVVASPAAAQSGIEVQQNTARGEFPGGIVFLLEVTAPAPFDEVRLSYRIAPDGVRASAVPDCIGTTRVSCTFQLSADQRNLLIPGAEVTYSWEMTSGAVNEETEPQTVLYEDTRFEWSSVSEGNLTVWYYGNDDDARSVLRAGREALDEVGALLQTSVAFPVKVRLYESAQEMQQAIISDNDEGVVTLGEVVYSDTAMVAANAAPLDITKHEIAHIVIREAVGGAFGVPDWLNEGTAVFAQSEPLPNQRQALESAIESGEVLSVRSMTSASSGAVADKVSLFYGQSWALVDFLIETYGEERFAAFFRAYASGASDDEALTQVYGLDQDGLENAWRESVGLPPREPVDAAPVPTEQLPQGGGEQLNGDDGESAPVALIVVIAAVTVALAGAFAGAAIILARRYR
jgi:hypothetical protein